jgi:hypothetical protein
VSGVAAIDAPGGFLFEWWSVFWDIFIARTNEKHSEVAASYIEVREPYYQPGVLPIVSSSSTVTVHAVIKDNLDNVFDVIREKPSPSLAKNRCNKDNECRRSLF